MADSALSQLPEVATSTDNDLMYTVQGGNTRRTTRAKIIAPAVRHDAAMSLDDAAKGRARSNISAASLGADGKVPLEELPDELFGDIETVDSEAEMLALDVPKGSIAVRTDVQKNFILKAEPASELVNWVELVTPTAPVTSVAGKTGNVELTPSDIDDSGNLQQLAALTLAARQILQTDETSALKAIALAANKVLNTDANGDILLSDVTQYGRTLLSAANEAAARTITGANRPMFTASVSSDIPVSSNGVYTGVPLNNVSVNVGNNWNGTRFRCPEAGNYFFSFTAQWNGGVDNLGYGLVRIRKNGGYTGNATATSKTLYRMAITVQSILALEVGDEIIFEFEISGGSGTDNVLQLANTRGTGFLIR